MEDGPPRFPQGFTCPVVLGCLVKKIHTFRIQDYHPLWSAFPCRSAIYEFCNSSDELQSIHTRSRNPLYATLADLHIQGLGSSRFARRYYGNRSYFLLLKVLRCFNSPRSPRTPMNSVHDDSVLPEPGSPIRTPPDQSLLAAPRRLSQLATSFIAFRYLGIHRLPLVA